MIAILYLSYTEENLKFKYFEFKLYLNNIYLLYGKLNKLYLFGFQLNTFSNYTEKILRNWKPLNKNLN